MKKGPGTVRVNGRLTGKAGVRTVVLADFRLAGLRIVAEFGGFDESPLNDDAADMVFVLQSA